CSTGRQMDSEKLKALQIRPEAKKRPQRSLWAIFLGVALVTALAAFYAWPKKEERRLLHGDKEQASSIQSSVAAAAPSIATNPTARPDGALLTVSGYIVNRERIELSPRFIGMVKWIGGKKGDTVTNGQVVVRLDDAEQKARLQEAERRLANAQVA